jgi:hypothetical protein
MYNFVTIVFIYKHLKRYLSPMKALIDVFWKCCMPVQVMLYEDLILKKLACF